MFTTILSANTVTLVATGSKNTQSTAETFYAVCTVTHYNNQDCRSYGITNNQHVGTTVGITMTDVATFFYKENGTTEATEITSTRIYLCRARIYATTTTRTNTRNTCSGTSRDFFYLLGTLSADGFDRSESTAITPNNTPTTRTTNHH